MTKAFLLSALAAAVVMSAACAVNQSEVPPLTGPSELALSIAVSATPDAITQDGKDYSTVKIVVRDENAKPRPGLALLFSVFPDGVGKFSNPSGTTTDSDGIFTIRYTARALAVGPNQVRVFVSPVLTNAQALSERSVDIRLLPCDELTSGCDGSVGLPTPGAPTAKFGYSPAPGHKLADVTFDASQSKAGTAGPIVRYDWDFGDGVTKSRTTPTVTHDYGAAGSYIVTLTVTDGIPQAHTIQGLIVVVDP